MREYTYRNEHGELWKLQVSEDGAVLLGGDETDGEMMTVGFPTLGSTIFSWQEMAWLATVMTQLEARRMLAEKLDSREA